MKKLLSQASLVAGALLFAAALQVGAFTEPTSSPPNANISAPINVGPVSQIKNGGWIAATGFGSTDGAIFATAPGKSVVIGTTKNPIGTLDVEPNDNTPAKICLNGKCTTALGGYSGTIQVTGTPYTTPANANAYVYGTFTITPNYSISIVNGTVSSITTVGGTATLNPTNDPTQKPKCDSSQQKCNGSDNGASATLICTSSGFKYLSYTNSGSGGAYGKPDSTNTFFIAGDQSCSGCSAISQVYCSL